MDTGERLSRYREIGWNIEALQCEREKLRGLILRLSARLGPERVQGGPPPSSGVHMDRLMDLERELGREIERLQNDRRQVVERIERVEKPIYRRVLKLKYLAAFPNAMIARKTGYDERHVRRPLRAALAELNSENKEEPI